MLLNHMETEEDPHILDAHLTDLEETHQIRFRKIYDIAHEHFQDKCTEMWKKLATQTDRIYIPLKGLVAPACPICYEFIYPPDHEYLCDSMLHPICQNCLDHMDRFVCPVCRQSKELEESDESEEDEFDEQVEIIRDAINAIFSTNDPVI